jgi:hypothetical protein
MIIYFILIYFIFRTVAYAKPLHSRHVESCLYNTRQVQTFFKVAVNRIDTLRTCMLMLCARTYACTLSVVCLRTLIKIILRGTE